MNFSHISLLNIKKEEAYPIFFFFFSHSTSFIAIKYFLKLLKFRKIINISILRNVLVD